MSDNNANTFLPIPSNPRFLDLTGRIFGKLVVLGLIARGNRNRPIWLCQCECGEMIRTATTQLTGGKTRSCGCLRHLPFARKHGHAGSPTYKIWASMRVRCNNSKDKSYPNYGGRGITVCERWGFYPNFLADMGERPSAKHSIERIDNDKGYSPENCHWALDREQRNNKRTSHMLTYRGKTQSLKLWCDELHLCYTTIRARLRRRWSVEKALTTPIDNRFS